jgi:hypothetical protein
MKFRQPERAVDHLQNALVAIGRNGLVQDREQLVRILTMGAER